MIHKFPLFKVKNPVYHKHTWQEATHTRLTFWSHESEQELPISNPESPE